jgi:hypothetical protein
MELANRNPTVGTLASGNILAVISEHISRMTCRRLRTFDNGMLFGFEGYSRMAALHTNVPTAAAICHRPEVAAEDAVWAADNISHLTCLCTSYRT